MPQIVFIHFDIHLIFFFILNWSFRSFEVVCQIETLSVLLITRHASCHNISLSHFILCWARCLFLWNKYVFQFLAESKKSLVFENTYVIGSFFDYFSGEY